MEWIIIISAVGTIIVSIITLLGSMYGMMKFLLRDVTKEIELIKKNQEEYRKDMKSYRDDMKSTNARMDGIYHLMLEGKYDLARKKLHEN